VLRFITSSPGCVALDVVNVHADCTDRKHRLLDRPVKLVARARAVHVLHCASEHLVGMVGNVARYSSCLASNGSRGMGAWYDPAHQRERVRRPSLLRGKRRAHKLDALDEPPPPNKSASASTGIRSKP